jgi:NTE family protein
MVRSLTTSMNFAHPSAGRHAGLLCRAGALVVLALLFVGCVQVPQSDPTPPTTPQSIVKRLPRIGLALGGGAARGFAHIGVIQVLEEAGIHVDLVAGTSAGSLVAALYASGQNGQALQRVAQSMDEAAFSDWRWPIFKPGVLRGEALARFVTAQVKGRQIQELPIPLGIVATDLRTGVGVLFQRGDIATAVRASSAVPAVFQPVSIDGRDYVDGGLVAPVPVSQVQKMGAELVIAVDISNDPESQDTQDTLQVLLQTFTIMGKSINSYELRFADLVVKPEKKGLASASFSSRLAAIQSGRQAMNTQMPVLRQLMLTKSRY